MKEERLILPKKIPSLIYVRICKQCGAWEGSFRTLKEAKNELGVYICWMHENSSKIVKYRKELKND